ncbi:hypothetical protein GPJ56_006776 [Histomonas meleagridis]|uniref:uncharacterized protein n=1 Tax=Histomonas meleagridis TaxID=135588 RepID=UPI00355A8EDC|nr:hypothetical protein GPJ56_006776 [Histomonas meleagridis]KAH0802171.1 hypothetical protein GO595_005030 [Histomonas meleagridis]
MLFVLLAASSIAVEYYGNHGEENGDFSSIISAAITILMSDGEQLTEINSISDAIKHCRSGCGLAVPSGPKLVKEMKKDKTYISFAVGKASTIYNKIVEHLKTQSGAGSFTLEIPASTVLSCLTLGHYVPRVSVTGTYGYKEVNGEQVCTFSASARIYGTDPWDFETHSSYSSIKNLILEIIPSLLVSLRGNMKPFDINYEATESYYGQFTK